MVVRLFLFHIDIIIFAFVRYHFMSEKDKLFRLLRYAIIVVLVLVVVRFLYVCFFASSLLHSVDNVIKREPSYKDSTAIIQVDGFVKSLRPAKDE